LWEDPLIFEIPGKPVPKARPRVMRGYTYTPAKTRNYENRVKLIAFHARTASKLSILGGSIRLKVICYGPHPRSDWDNLGKAISDALNGVLYMDDSQVVEATVMKYKCPKGQEKTVVEVCEVRHDQG
jgi:Holliday junction resolvase RusA-like endonuclease